MKEDQRPYQERIIADPRILAGKPVVKGARIAVDLVLEELAQNLDIAELLAAHPDLTRTDVQACLAYAQAIVTGEEAAPGHRRGLQISSITPAACSHTFDDNSRSILHCGRQNTFPPSQSFLRSVRTAG